MLSLEDRKDRKLGFEKSQNIEILLLHYLNGKVAAQVGAIEEFQCS